MRIALTELRRRPGRFAPAAFALALLTLLLLVLGGLLDGLYNGSSGALRAQPGDLLTYSSDAKLSLVRSRIDSATVAEVEAVSGVEAAGGLGTALLGAEVPNRSEEASVALFGYQLAPRGVPSPPGQTGEVFADRSLEAYGVKAGQTLLLGPAEYPVVVVGWVTDTNFLLQGGLWGNLDTWRAALASARPDAVLATGTVQALTVTIAEGVDASQVATAIDDATGGATKTVTRADAVASLPGLEQQRTTFNSIIYTTFFVAALVVSLFFAPAHPRTHRDVRGVQGGRGIESADLHPSPAPGPGDRPDLLHRGWAPGLRGQLRHPAAGPRPAHGHTAFEVGVGLIIMSTIGVALSLRRVVRIDPTTA